MSVADRVSRLTAGDDTEFDERSLVGIALITPAILLILGVLIYPFLDAIRLSFVNIDTGEFVGLRYYEWLVSRDNFWAFTGKTILWTVGNLALQGFFGVTIAIALNRAFPGRSIVRTLILIPFVIPTAVTGILWRWLFNGSWGPINVVLQDLGVISEPFTPLVNNSLALPMVTLINAWRWAPLVALIVLAVLQTIPEEQYEAARLEGANLFQEFYHVTYPHLTSALTVLGLLGFLITFNIFDMIWVLTRGGPGTATTTLPVFIYEVAFNRQEIGHGNAISVALLGMLLVFVVLFFWRNDVLDRGDAQ